MADQICLLAPAKINWSLEILGKRADGYHQLRSVIQNIDLYDRVTLSWSDRDECVCLPAVDCLPADNLALRAWLLLKEAYAIPRHLQITIKKDIPAGRGLGGGSADAAAVLLGVNVLAGLERSLEELSKLAFPLGADIPFCLYGGLALVEGAGEIVKTYVPGVDYRLILADPGVFVSTREVFRRFDEIEADTRPDIDALLPALLCGNIKTVSASMGNMLERPAQDFYPGIDELKTFFAAIGYSACLSGSGSCLFAVGAEGKNEAENLALLARKGIKTRTVHTMSHGVEIV